MKQLLIKNEWVTPPKENLKEWLMECIGVELDFDLLIPKRYIHRYELVQACRISPRHKPENIRITL